ncbi:thrombospondin type-1 domain-containing protein [Patescibacteria group bacterium]|nr:thrombospondin type-1 domain-containing protein [Patescibacteria group bacterium]
MLGFFKRKRIVGGILVLLVVLALGLILLFDKFGGKRDELRLSVKSGIEDLEVEMIDEVRLLSLLRERNFEDRGIFLYSEEGNAYVKPKEIEIVLTDNLQPFSIRNDKNGNIVSSFGTYLAGDKYSLYIYWSDILWKDAKKEILSVFLTKDVVTFLTRLTKDVSVMAEEYLSEDDYSFINRYMGDMKPVFRIFKSAEKLSLKSILVKEAMAVCQGWYDCGTWHPAGGCTCSAGSQYDYLCNNNGDVCGVYPYTGTCSGCSPEYCGSPTTRSGPCGGTTVSTCTNVCGWSGECTINNGCYWVYPTSTPRPPTNTPISPPTNTPPPGSTNTPIPPPTNTPPPGSTSTPIPPPTNTPPPGATNTPTPRPPTNTPTLRPTPTGTCAPDCSCASSTCVGSSCPDGCGGWCSGTLPQLAGTWSSWSSCSACIQTRTCTLGQCGGACVGSSSRACGLVDGGWSSWDDDCSTACGQTRYRTCTNPPPACGGADCVGSSSDVCSDADDGSPAITVISSPSGTQSNPTNLGQITVVPLNWNQNSSSLTDYYQVRVYDSSDNLDWSDNYVSGRSTTSVTTGSLALGEVYHWRVRAVNNDCGIDYGAWSSYGYFRLNTEPELDDFEVRNDDDDIVPADSADPGDGDDRYQICDVEFIQGGSHSRQVRFVIEVTDDDGVNEIEEISLRLDGAGSVTVSNLTTSPVSSFTGGGWSIYSAVEVSLVGGNLRVVFPMEFNEDFDNVNIYDVDVRVEDVYGDSSGWEDTGTNFMVWSCQVCDVGGNLYDASLTPFAWPVCPDEGYSILGEDMNLTSVVFEGAGIADVDMEVISDNEYIRTGDCLIWGYVYTPELNSDLRGSIPVIRVTDVGSGVVRDCDNDVDMTDSDGDVDPYSAVPSLQVDFSSVRDQDAWYQVVGCGGKAGQLLVDNVPNTCAVDVDCIESLSINSTRMANGLVVAPVVRNNSGCGDNCSFSDPNDWYAQIDTSVNLGTYQDLYSEYFVNLGLGVTYVSNTTMSDIESDVGGRGIVFVNGNLVVDVNNNIPVGEFLVVQESEKPLS